ncbi:MAG: nucleotide pyrophosphatase [Caulobacteraceae bacterium]|nr:nucleotide pyrophosphatase [Caulobacteraceae bacterium]
MKVGIWIGVLLVTAFGLSACNPAGRPHNVIIFVADGLRSGMVSEQTAPALAAVRREGVDFANSHSVYPTFTTVNASSLATGHAPGDHGDFGNALLVGEPLGMPVNSPTPFLEDDETLGLMNDRFGGNYLNEESLLALARKAGFQTAAIGKVGPTSIQDVTARDGQTLVIDDETGGTAVGAKGLPLPPAVVSAIKAAGLPTTAPGRDLNGGSGAYNAAGTFWANTGQQKWFADIAAKVVLPMFAKRHKPFVMVYWSRDPDGTQHNQGDSLNSLTPGINGPTSLKAIRNASDNLQQLRDALKTLGLDKTTDIIVTADHGFSTISKQSATSTSTRLHYVDVVPGFLPPGFLGLDLAKGLNLPLHDLYGLPMDPLVQTAYRGTGQLLGADPKHPDLVVAINGGTDLLYLPKGDKALARRAVDFLVTQDYVSALFVDDQLGAIPGTLALSAIGLQGKALTPVPAIVVSFRSVSTGCDQPELCAAEVADSTLQQGQGMHGAFSRADTHNFTAAVGPDFKAGYRDAAPMSNADLPVTLIKILGLKSTSKGALTGRVLSEAIGGGAELAGTPKVVRSAPAANGFVTQLCVQEAAGHAYYDAAGAPGTAVGLETCAPPALRQ